MQYASFRRQAMPQTHHFQPLIDRLTAADGEPLILSLTEIATLIGCPLPRSARTNPRFWRLSGYAIPRALIAEGWRATLHPQEYVVTFTRTGNERRPNGLDPLRVYLATREGETVLLSLEQVEAILGGYLVRTARLDPAWWDGRERHARTWEALGWKARLDIRRRSVEFRRIRDEVTP
jgi:hypothetical protein